MRFIRTALALSLMFPVLGAAQGAPPTIGTILPDSLPTTGGVEVVVTGTNLDLPPGYACVAECPPVVRFDTHEVKAHEWTDTRVVVKAPPHAKGLVGVTVITGDGRTVSRPAAVTYVPSPEEAWEAVLVPVYLEESTPGASGSLWQTELWLRNNADIGVNVAPWPCPEGQACPPVFPSQRSFQPGQSHSGLPKSPTHSANPGRLLFLPDANAGDVSFGLRVLDASRAVTAAGTEIPVVRPAQFRTKAAQLLNVPYDPAIFRYTLRIYDLARVSTRFVVRIYDQRDQPIGEVYVTTSLTDPSPLFPFEPAYAAVDITQAVPRERAGQPLRVEVAPLEPYSRFWTMLTITSSDQVTLVTPQ